MAKNIRISDKQHKKLQLFSSDLFFPDKNQSETLGAILDYYGALLLVNVTEDRTPAYPDGENEELQEYWGKVGVDDGLEPLKQVTRIVCAKEGSFTEQEVNDKIDEIIGE